MTQPAFAHIAAAPQRSLADIALLHVPAEGGRGEATFVIVSPTAGAPAELLVWDATSRQPLPSQPLHAAGATCVAACTAPEAALAAVGFADGGVEVVSVLHEAEGGEEEAAGTGDDSDSQGGAGGASGVAARGRVLPAHSERVVALAFALGGRVLLSASESGDLRVTRVRGGRLVAAASRSLGHTGHAGFAITSVHISPHDDALAMVASANGHVSTWRLSPAPDARPLHSLAVARAEPTLAFFSPATTSELLLLPVGSARSSSGGGGAGAQVLVLAAHDRTVRRVLGVGDGAPVLRAQALMAGGLPCVACLAADGTVRVVEVESGEVLDAFVPSLPSAPAGALGRGEMVPAAVLRFIGDQVAGRVVVALGQELATYDVCVEERARR